MTDIVMSQALYISTRFVEWGGGFYLVDLFLHQDLFDR